MRVIRKPVLKHDVFKEIQVILSENAGLKNTVL